MTGLMESWEIPAIFEMRLLNWLATWEAISDCAAAGSPVRVDPFFGATTVWMALHGYAMLHPARPDFPMHTLTVTGTSLAGRPDSGDVVDVFNVNDLAAFDSGGSFYRGTAKFSVPSGTYWALGSFIRVFSRRAEVREVVLADLRQMATREYLAAYLRAQLDWGEREAT